MSMPLKIPQNPIYPPPYLLQNAFCYSSSFSLVCAAAFRVLSMLFMRKMQPTSKLFVSVHFWYFKLV